MHSVNFPDSFFAALNAVEHLGTGLQATRVHPHIGEFSQVRVGHDLECQCAKGLVVTGLAQDFDFFVAHFVPVDRSDVKW